METREESETQLIHWVFFKPMKIKNLYIYKLVQIRSHGDSFGHWFNAPIKVLIYL